MCTVFVNLNSVLFLGIYVSGNVLSFIYYKAPLSGLLCTLCKNTAEKSCTNYQIIISHLIYPFKSSALSVFSQGSSTSVLPKCPYADVAL